MNHKNLDRLTKIIHNWAPQIFSYVGLSRKPTVDILQLSNDIVMDWNEYHHLIINFDFGKKFCLITADIDRIEGRLKTQGWKDKSALIYETDDKRLAIKYYDKNIETVLYLTKNDPLIDFKAHAKKQFNNYCPLDNFLKQDLYAHYKAYVKKNGVKNHLLGAKLGAIKSNKNSATQKKRASTRFFDVYMSSSKGVDVKQLNGVDTYKIAVSWGFKGILKTFYNNMNKGIWEAQNANSYIKITPLIKGKLP